jgi:large subunit ribosomal protein L10
VDEPRPEKVAVVDEVRERLSSVEAALLTEYRGLDVPAMAALRAALREAGGEYKVYKNTLVRFAVSDLGLDLDDLLVGPTAIAFVADRPDGSAGDAVSLARALSEFARSNEALVIKGGLLDGRRLSVDEVEALAKIATREVLLAQLAGAIAAPLQQFAGLLTALPQNLAYALQALIDQRGGVEAPAADTGVDAVADEAPADDTEVAADVAAADTDAVADEAPADDTEVAADVAAADTETAAAENTEEA